MESGRGKSQIEMKSKNDRQSSLNPLLDPMYINNNTSNSKFLSNSMLMNNASLSIITEDIVQTSTNIKSADEEKEENKMLRSVKKILLEPMNYFMMCIFLCIIVGISRQASNPLVNFYGVGKSFSIYLFCFILSLYIHAIQ